MKLPYSQLDEEAVLGCILSTPDVLCDWADSIKQDYFYLPAHRKIASTILRMYANDQPVDVLAVYSELGKDVEGTKDLAVSLAQLPDRGCLSTSLKYHVDKLKNLFTLRSLIIAADEIKNSALQVPDDAASLAGNAANSIFDIFLANSKEPFFKDIVLQAYRDIEALGDGGVVGLSSGLVSLDAITKGFGPGELIVLAGRPSSGKTALAVFFMLDAIFRQNMAVAFFSLEMSAREVIRRMLSFLGEVVIDSDMSKDDWVRVNRATNLLLEKENYIFIDDTPLQTPVDIKLKSKKMKAKKDIKMVIVDYLQLVDNRIKGATREREVADASRQMKGLAKDIGVPVILLSQLNRGVDLREEKRPRLADLRESGAIEQDADKVLFIYDDNEHPGVNIIECAKHRNGKRGKIAVQANWGFNSFKEHPFFADEATVESAVAGIGVNGKKDSRNDSGMDEEKWWMK